MISAVKLLVMDKSIVFLNASLDADLDNDEFRAKNSAIKDDLKKNPEMNSKKILFLQHLFAHE